MSAKALSDLHVLPVVPDKSNVYSSKGSFTKASLESENGNVKTGLIKKPVSMVSSDSVNEVQVLDSDATNANVELEYIESENLPDLQDVDANRNSLLARLDSKDWVSVCEALNHVRQFALFHKEVINEILGDVISLVVKSLKNPRSAVCKTAIMTCGDILKVYGDQTIDIFEPLLVQLLLKSSQDKRFVCAAAERALVTMTSCLSPTLLLPKLQPYLHNRNPRIRAKALTCISRSVPRLGFEGVKAYGFDELINIAASKLSDQLPESREAARVLTLELEAAYKKSQLVVNKLDSTTASADDYGIDAWEHFCQSKLPPSTAHAVLRVTSSTRDALVLEC